MKKIVVAAVCAVMVLVSVSAFAESLKEIQAKAKQGDSEAQYTLGNCTTGAKK